MTQLKEFAKKNMNGDPVIWGIVFMLSILSLLVVYSATGSLAYRKMGGNTEYYMLKHIVLQLVAFFAMWVAHRIDYKFYAKYAKIGLIFSSFLVVFAWVYGTTLNQASRWVKIPFIGSTFQPSDLLKIALIAFVAVELSRKQQDIRNPNLTTKLVLIIGGCCAAIAMSDISTSILLLLTCGLLLFIGRIPLKYLGLSGFVAGALMCVALFFGQRMGTATTRLSNYFDSEVVSFQQEQSFIALSKGGLTGEGPGRSVQKNFLPHPYSDFVYAIIIEEYGIVGGGFVLLLFLILLYRGMVTSSASDRPFGSLLSAGLCFSIVFQAMINIGVVTGLLPVTGLPLPMVSLGGSSLITTGMSIGIILSISRKDDNEKEEIKEEVDVSKNRWKVS